MERPMAASGENLSRKIYTVSELTSEIQSRLESAYPFIWLTGEVANFTRSSAGHLYFSLKDENAQISAVIFKGQARQIKFQLESGLKLVGFGRISLYPPRGTYQVILEYVEPLGKGSLQLAFEQVKARLQAEGLFDLHSKKPLPFLPKRITLITSPFGAAIHDMLKVLRRRYPNLAVEIAAVRVQGDGAAEEMALALQRVNTQAKSDLVILARGGGSVEDLAAFNDENLARTIFSSNIPVLTGIGHETDFTIADFVADQRASTPTAAAEMAVPDKAALLSLLHQNESSLFSFFKQRLERFKLDVQRCHEKLMHPGRMLDRSRMALDEAERKLHIRMSRLLSAKKQEVFWLKRSLEAQTPQEILSRVQMQFQSLEKRLLASLSGNLATKGLVVKGLETRLVNLSPYATLKRGYAIATSLPEGRLLMDTQGLEPGSEIELQLAAGSLRCRIEEVHHGEKKF